ncbi:putative oxidoreductase [Corynebacterium kalinowskii]|uniref:Oxidoreductase n=1 Tax=Corynebacterium kalinowskii TaxID=2675216 RepID=A0A6B8VQX6_9CORY|nr:SDR family oxidoreductase [Corynebacterium kalinowskii]QGU01987.1 putative oxidoreductase [Corynebacterium kalinowskii]
MTVLILGATSDIGGEIAKILCPGRTVVMCARRPDAIPALPEAKEVHVIPFEASDLTSHRLIVNEAAQFGPITHAVVCFGILGSQERALSDEAHAAEIATIDYTAQVSMLTVLADVLRQQSESSTIYAFSSIAGWRARKANYVYGSTKAGLDAFCQGLMDELHGSRVSLVLARPGFVIGSMTEGMKPAPMSVTPRVVAEAVVKQQRSGTIWIPGRLRLLAWVMKLVPRPVWRHMPR